MDIQEVINQIAAGDSAAAKEGIENVLSAKAFHALQGRKQEMAATIFGGQEQEHEEVTDDEEAYAEDVEHDGEQEQLDELSKATLKSYQKKAVASLNKSKDTMKKLEGKAGIKTQAIRGGWMNSPNIESLPTKQQNQYEKAKKTTYNRYYGVRRSLDRTKSG